MKKHLVILIAILAISVPSFARHIKGGEMVYEYLRPGSAPNTSEYRITLKLYLDCTAMGAQLDDDVPLTIFSRSTNQQIGSVVRAPMTNEQYIRFDPASNPCISNPPLDVCYRIRSYTTIITVGNDPNGYTVAFQRCCRIENIINLGGNSGNVGATYYCEIPGTNAASDANKNLSPRFGTNDAVAVCGLSNFTIDYSADEPDGTDSIIYRLCSGFIGASQGTPQPGLSSNPPYTDLSYQSPYSGSAPFGQFATIDSKTGIVTGIAPATIGQYVITVCAYEYRRDTLIGIHRKDIHVKVSDCIPLQALLKPDYSYCDDFKVTFKNEQFNPPGSLYIWSFGDGTKSDSTMDPEGKVLHTYGDTGTYQVKLKVILAGQCLDSTTTLAKVYPGFFPNMSTVGTCKFTPIQFTDNTQTRYGNVVKWSWNFGDETTSADTSNKNTPTWLYNSLGFKRVILNVESDKGCKGTYIDTVEIRDKPPIIMPFKDTLICSIDTLQLRAVGNGVFSWAPNANMINEFTATPLVYPKTTTTYQVTLNENGCINTESLRVRVVDFVTLNMGPDTTICLTDSARLQPATDGLQFTWSPAATLSNPSVRSPMAGPLGTTTYQLISRIGKCNTTGDVIVKTVPYPLVNAGQDTTICYQDTAQLKATTDGATFTWTPVTTLNSGNTLNPLAFPLKTTPYNLTAYDTLGCPRPGIDTVLVSVQPRLNAFAGNGTAIVLGQPLLLRGTGAEFFKWSPPAGLNNANISMPVATLSENATYIMEAFTEEGCFATDTINIKVFKTQPDIFVPNAFAPGGRNRILRPIPVGISEFAYFRVYNRWGQLVFHTTEAGRGWDGTIAGKNQDAGTYVWMVRGKDYTGKTISKKGAAVLIR